MYSRVFEYIRIINTYTRTGEYTLKTVEYIQKQDAEGGYTKKAVDAIKESVGSK